MFKKLLIAVGVVVAALIVFVIVAGVIIYIKVDKTFIAAQMSSALNRQVTIEKIDISIFSVLSGIEIKNVAISNFKTPRELSNLQGKPVAAGDVFAGMDTLRFKVRILPLFQRQVVLKELVLYSPVINLSKNKNGVMNINDLIQSKKPAGSDDKTKQEQAAEKNKKTLQAGKAEPAKEPAKPLSADDIPVAVAVGEIGMKNGTINYHDGEFDQSFQIYKLTTLAYDIQVDPKDLEKKDEVKVKLTMGIKTVGAMKTGSVQSFDITIDAAGKVIPFDVKTRLLEPEAILHIAVPDGEITGLQVFHAIAAVPVLGEYLGEHISFLKEKQQWKGARQNGLDLRYKASRLEIADGRLDLKDAGLRFNGGMNIDTKAVDMNVGVMMQKETNEAIQTMLAKKIESAIKSPEVKKYADSKSLAAIAMKPLLNKDGRIELKAKVSGTTKKPEVKLTEPQLGSLSNLIKDNAGAMVLEAGKGAVKQLLNEDQQKVLKEAEKLFK